MSLCRLARGVMSLVFDAVEAVVYLFDWSDPADKIWADARDRLADTEAEEEVTEPRDLASVRCACGAVITVTKSPFIKSVVGPCPGCGNQFYVKIDAKSSERDCSPSGAPGAGSATTGEPNTVATAAKVPSGSEIRAHSPEGHLTSSPAPASAGDEPPSRSVPAPDVEREGMVLDQSERNTLAWALRKFTTNASTLELASVATRGELLRLAQKLDPAT